MAGTYRNQVLLKFKQQYIGYIGSRFFFYCKVRGRNNRYAKKSALVSFSFSSIEVCQISYMLIPESTHHLNNEKEGWFDGFDIRGRSLKVSSFQKGCADAQTINNETDGTWW